MSATCRRRTSSAAPISSSSRSPGEPVRWKSGNGRASCGTGASSTWSNDRDAGAPRMGRKRLTARDLAAAIEERTGHAFQDLELLSRALTHASARDKAGFDYQRLEFLGDRVLGLVVAEMLFEAFPDAEEGELSVRLNALVNAETLAEIADEVGLADLIPAGSEVRALSARKGLNLRADVMEALIAALYLEGGLDAARRFIRAHWTERSQAADAARGDPKTVLQEWAHRVSG